MVVILVEVQIMVVVLVEVQIMVVVLVVIILLLILIVVAVMVHKWDHPLLIIAQRLCKNIMDTPLML